MNAKSSFIRTAGLVAGTLSLLAPAWAADDVDVLPQVTENYIRYSAGGMDMKGSKSSAQARTGIPKVGAAGIEAFNLTRELDNKTSLQIDGQALPGAEDYLAQFKVTKAEFGSVEAGYKQFRTFYDGVGGFLPTNNAWIPLYSRALYVDRGKFFVDAKLELPKAPVFTLKYINETRDGRKDSTIWGDSTANSGRKILPAVIDLDERQQLLQGAVKQTFGRTTATLSLTGTRIKFDNSRTVDRITATPNRGADKMGLDEKGWSANGTIETVVNETTTFFAGANYRHSDGDITGSRLINVTMNSSAGPINGIGGFTAGGRPAYSYTSDGSIDLDVYTANAGVRLKPAPNFSLEAALKAEDFESRAKNLPTYVNTLMNPSTGAVASPILISTPSWSRVSEKVWSPEIDARYTGIPKTALFASWSYRSSPGDESFSDSHATSSAGSVAAATTLKSDRVKENHSNAKIGGNWTPDAMLSMRAELYTKDHENRFTGYGASAGDFFILDYNIYGTRVSATVRPAPQWSATTRWTTQFGKAKVAIDAGRTDSNDAKRHQLSETVNWTPSKVFYMQADVNLVYDTIITSYPKVGGAANLVNQNADNNYWNGSVLAGFVVDKVTTAHLQGTYYKSNNYQPGLAVTGFPYGSSAKEYGINAGVTRKLSDRWMASAKIGYFESRNDTLGGYANFHGPIGYLTLQQSL